MLDGEVAATGGGEYGNTEMELAGSSLLLEDFPEASEVWMSHRDAVEKAPAGFTVTARTPGASVAAMEDRSRGFYGVQFHPEVTHTPGGMDVIERFLYRACGARAGWTADSIIETEVEAYAARWGMRGRCADFREAWIRRSPPPWCTGRSETVSPVCSWTTDCSARASLNRWKRCSVKTSPPTSSMSRRRRAFWMHWPA